MTILTFPALTPRSADFGLVSNTQAFMSPISGTTQTLEMPGARWRVQMAFDGLDDAEIRLLKTFLVQCRGMGGRFYYGDPLYLKNGPTGIATGTPLVNGASQTGTSLITDGWTVSQTGIVKAGDYLHFDNASGGRELHMIVADANSDGAGDATLSIEPAIRVAPADDAAITISGAMAQMRLSDNDMRWQESAPAFGSIVIDAVESFTDAA
jgi:hypothetical protein